MLRTCSLDKMGQEVVPTVKSKVLGCSMKIQLCLSGKVSPSSGSEFSPDLSLQDNHEENARQISLENKLHQT